MTKIIKVLKKIYALRWLGIGRLCIAYLYTRIAFPNARLVRGPVYIRREGILRIGKNFSSNAGLIIETYGRRAKIMIGQNVQVNYRLHIGAIDEISIGNDTLIGSDVLIIDHLHGSYSRSNGSDPRIAPQKRTLTGERISIGERCWIGDKVSILPGVMIGDGTIIGANSVVTKNICANSIAVGNPARVIKRWNNEKNMWEKYCEEN